MTAHRAWHLPHPARRRLGKRGRAIRHAAARGRPPRAPLRTLLERCAGGSWSQGNRLVGIVRLSGGDGLEYRPRYPLKWTRGWQADEGSSRFVALGIVGGFVLGVGAVPAFADGPPVPAGCTFNQATGVLSCVTSSSTTTTVGPFTTNGFVAASTTFGRFTGAQICTAELGGSYAKILLTGALLTETVTTTTTTLQHGLHGKVFDTSTSTSTSLTNVIFGPGDGMACSS